jgi:N-acetylglucosamine kinase-like BadF-type ATPase
MSAGGILGLGIDAGGTQTRWALATAAGEVVADGHAPGMTALQLGTNDGCNHIRAVFAEIARGVHAVGQPMNVCAGVTGLDARDERLCELMAAPLKVQSANISVQSDIAIACRDLFRPGEGYVVYAGTGSIAAYIDANDVFHRAGGRGVMLDDAGGGFWIAREALRHIWRIEDETPGAWQESPMAVAMFHHIGGSEWGYSRQFFYGKERGDIGKLALAVAASADKDAFARALMIRAGEELARLGNAMVNRFGPRPIALAGRAVLLHSLIESTLRAALPEGLDVQLRVSEAHAAAARIAARAPARLSV